jgi:hypothetical protein
LRRPEHSEVTPIILAARPGTSKLLFDEPHRTNENRRHPEFSDDARPVSLRRQVDPASEFDSDPELGIAAEAKAKRQKAKGKRQKAKGKRQKAKGN